MSAGSGKRGVPMAPRTKGEGPTVAIAVRLEREDWLAFRAKAAADGKAMSEILKEFVAQYIKQK